MRIWHDPDLYEVVTESTPCTVCGGDPTKCNGGCNGSAGYWTRRRSDEEVAAIKAEKLRAHEDAILAEADAIRARRSST